MRVPIRVVAHAVLLLHGKVEVMRRGNFLGRDPGGVVTIDVHRYGTCGSNW